MNISTHKDPLLELRLAQRERPDERPVMYQSWQQLLFLHWRIDPAVIQSILPKGLTVDTYDVDAWVGVVPFLMRNIRPCWAPAVPGISNFLELNLRTYAINEQGVPGVWFLSLDANTRLGVWWAKTFFRLPYVYAKMDYTHDPKSGRIDYKAHRPGTEKRLASHFSYQPLGGTRTAEPGSLDFFLVERYILFSQQKDGTIQTGQVHHPPYEYSDAESSGSDILFELNGLPRPERPADHVAMCKSVDVDIFALKSS